MDKRVIQERMRRKRRQLMLRKLYRLVGCVVGALLVVVVLFKFVISPLAGKISGNGTGSVEAQAQTQEVDSTQAVRMPVKDQSNVTKTASQTVGWQEDANGKWYQNADGTYYANGLMEIDGKTYYFDENGYITTGWVDVDGVDYMFNDSGVYDPNQKRQMVALTFDDGPGKYTDKLLDCLEENDAKATFFMLGSNVSSWPDTIKRMKEMGCELGNHSYDHPQLPNLTGEQVTEQFQKTNSLLEEICGSPATVARTPYGAQDETILSYVGMPCFMWSIDTLDWQTLNADSTYNTTMENVSDGDIILMHDIHETSVEAAIRLIPDLIEKGYKLVTVSELAKANGIELENGKSYSDFWAATVSALKGTESSDGTSDSEEPSDPDVEEVDTEGGSDNSDSSDAGNDSDSGSDSDSGYSDDSGNDSDSGY